MDDSGDLPELATNDDWRGVMVRARKEHGLTQTQLASKVGTSQNVISLIESGESGSSKFILPICKELQIPPPMFFEDDEDRAWHQLGRLLRAKNMKQYRRALGLIETMVDDTGEAGAEPPEAPAKPTRPK